MAWRDSFAKPNPQVLFTLAACPDHTVGEDTERRRRNCSPPLLEDLSTEQRLLSHSVLVQRPLERCPLLEGEQWVIVSPSLEK